MRGPVLERYLLREGFGAWVAVTLVLLAIMLATRFARFLAEAAAGALPREFLMKVVALSSLQYLVILIPVSLLLAVLLSLGRMYRDQEIAAMTGCGVGPWVLYRPFLGLALAISLLTAALSFQIGPWAGRQADYLVKDAQRLVQFTPFEPGVFREVGGGRAVFYTAGMDSPSGTLETVFALFHEERGSSVITAQRGLQERDPQNGDRIVHLEQGYRYTGTPGQAAYDIVRFDTLTTRVAPPAVLYTTSRRKIQETGKLLASSDMQDQAELQWRIAAPVSVLLLALLAVPLSHASPREGRYGKLVLGLLVYLIYTNLLAMGQAWIAKGIMPVTVGLWWVHALAAALAFWMIARRMGWVLPKRIRMARRGERRNP